MHVFIWNESVNSVKFTDHIIRIIIDLACRLIALVMQREKLFFLKIYAFMLNSFVEKIKDDNSKRRRYSCHMSLGI